MKTQPDLYSKIILTIIAIALIVIVLKDYDIIPNARASSDEVMNVKIMGFGPDAFSTKTASGNLISLLIPVEIKKPLTAYGNVSVESQH